MTPLEFLGAKTNYKLARFFFGQGRFPNAGENPGKMDKQRKEGKITPDYPIFIS